MKPVRVRLRAAGVGRGGGRAARRARRRGQGAGRRPEPRADAEHAARPALRVVDVNRLPLGEVATTTARGGSARSSARPTAGCSRSRSWRSAYRTSATSSRATAERSAGRSPTRTPPPNWRCADGARRLGRDERRPDASGRGVFRHALHHGARTRRAARRDALAGGRSRRSATRSRRSPSGTATSRCAWQRRRVARRDCASQSARSSTGPTVLAVDPERPGESAAEQVEPWGSLHASADYLRNLVRVVVDRVVERVK